MMNNEKYESPEIRVISVEPDESLMVDDMGASYGASQFTF